MGTLEMIKEGALGDGEAVFGMHVSYVKLTDKTGSSSGPLLAALFHFEARIEGKGRVVSEPHSSGSNSCSITFSFGIAAAHLKGLGPP